MELADVERRLFASAARTVLVDPRTLRRIIKARTQPGGLGLAVPHARCFAIERQALLAIPDAAELAARSKDLPEQVLLVARPPLGELAGRKPDEVLARLWRTAFHASVHAEMDRRTHAGELGPVEVRRRIDEIGQVEFDEVRSALSHDGALLPPFDDAATWTELVATWLELHHFAPDLLATTFPSLADSDAAESLVRAEVDAAKLLSDACPEGVDPAATVARASSPDTSSPTFSAPMTIGLSAGYAPPPPTRRRADHLSTAGQRELGRGRHVRAALLFAVAARSDDAHARRAGRDASKDALDRLGDRLDAALRPPGETEGSRVEWTSLLYALAERATEQRRLRWPVEARLLYDLERAALAHERPHRAVDLVTWALSRGRRPIVRDLPATREVRIARHVHAAARKLRNVRLASAERKLLAKLLGYASDRADRNVRTALRAKILEALQAVGLRPNNLPERVARDAVIEQLLDQAAEDGFLTLGHVRDALSRSQLKVRDLGGPGELVRGDAVLATDRVLARTLDGVYRRGEIYMRTLQRVSSLPFGTRVGRVLTFFVVLPVGGAFLILEGSSHMVAPVAGWLDMGHPHFRTHVSHAVTALVLLGLIHSSLLRRVALRIVDVVGMVLRLVLLRVPRWIIGLPAVQRALTTTIAHVFFRRVLAPAVVATLVFLLTGLRHTSFALALAVSATTFAVTSWLFDERVAGLAEDLFVDWVAPTFRAVGQRFIPGLFRLIVDTFRTLMELLEKAMVQVEELLRLRVGESRPVMAGKAVVGLAWFFVAYVIRLYITLLVEPEINPLKHFPVVTVAHKLMIPVTPDLLRIVGSASAPLGPIVGNAFTWVTVGLLPSVFGFLAWELKENRKLYRASRSPTLEPVHVGDHGETIAGLLVPGIYSGTLPKLHERLRRAAQREDTTLARSDRDVEGARGRFREGRAAIERSVGRFVERELTAALETCPRWTAGAIRVKKLDLASNRIRVTLSLAAGGETAELVFEGQSGLVVAGIPRPGFIATLSDGDRLLFENALGGFYQMAAVDLSRERIEAVLGPDDAYDVADEGLVVWPGGAFETELVYELVDEKRGALVARVRGRHPESQPPELDAAAVFFKREKTPWWVWVRAWSEDPDLPPGRVLGGPPILPERASVERPATLRAGVSPATVRSG